MHAAAAALEFERAASLRDRIESIRRQTEGTTERKFVPDKPGGRGRRGGRQVPRPKRR